MGAAAIAMIVRHEKDIVTLFRSAGALSAATARPLGSLGIEESRHLERLQRAEVIRTGAPGTWYLDETSWSERMLKRRRIGITVLVVALLALAFGLGFLPSGPR